MNVLSGAVIFRNDTGAKIPPFGLVRLAEVVRRRPDNELVFKGLAPLACPMEELYVNGDIEVAPSEYGRAKADDRMYVGFARGDGVPIVGHPWGVKDGGSELRKWYGGFLVLQAPPETTDKIVLVRRVACHEYWGKLAESITAGALDDPKDSDVTVWQTGPRETTDPVDYQASSITLKAINRDPSLSGGSGSVCRVRWINGEWSLTWVGC